MKVTVKPNPSALAQLYAEADKKLAAMAEAGADALRENLSAGSRSGVQYPSLPRRSSAPGQYSQEQSGTLKGMVESGQSGPLKHWFGLVPKGTAERAEALAQEFGAPRNGLVGRANVRRTALDSRLHRQMVAVARRS